MSTTAETRAKRRRRSYTDEFQGERGPAGARGGPDDVAARDLDVTESALRTLVEYARADRSGGTTGLDDGGA